VEKERQRLTAALQDIVASKPEPEAWAYCPANAQHERESCVGTFPTLEAAVTHARGEGWGAVRVGLVTRLELPSEFLDRLTPETSALFSLFASAARRVTDCGWTLNEDDCRTVRT
jgi:hypothetical protein